MWFKRENNKVWSVEDSTNRLDLEAAKTAIQRLETATKNASDMIDKLNQAHNKLSQKIQESISERNRLTSVQKGRNNH